MDNLKIKAGLIGCGHLGSIHCKLLNEISNKRQDIEFIGIYDIDGSRTNEISDKFKIKSFNSYDELLSEINSVIIVTPTSTHYDIAAKAIEKGINIFIEKPVTSNVNEANELINLAKNTNCKIQVGHVERFNPALTSLAKYNLQPLFIESHRLSQFNPRGTDVSVIHDLMIHDIDIILHLVKSPVKTIDANGVAVISDNIDIANARITFENGCVANITASRISLKKMRKMRLFQKSAYISIDFAENKSEIYRIIDNSDIDSSPFSFPVSETRKIVMEQPEADVKDNNPIRNELESFFDSIIFNKEVKVTIEEAKQAVKVAEKIIEKISTNKNFSIA
ncbi:MAG: gfo/Idh/MocA family oxidoreductase [Ignavibacteriae bacterium]|nr:MAG: gfo/Idh/MocA family oxidoreductase [Ignavibacteriota bacterium]